MKIENEQAGEVLVVRDPERACIEVHIKGTTFDDYRLVRLARGEARRLAALILFQAERLENDRAPRRMAIGEVEPKTA